MKYTPATIVDKYFSIPLYQRLFEWDEPQITQLLNDLYDSFKKTPYSPYYIGMLTVYEEDKCYSLVDGQQRFTVLTLLGIYLDWKSFTSFQNESRLRFAARKQDQNYLEAKIYGNEPIVCNSKMENGLKVIDGFFEKNNDEAFKTYIYKQTTFFISKLPESYSIQDLNRYFEAMNEAGKGLASHEILKVKLLKLASDNYNEYALLWNMISEMSRILIRPKAEELQNDYQKRYINTIKENSIKAFIDSKDSNQKREEFLSIRNISENKKKPESNQKEGADRAILSFPDFLLQVLWLSIEANHRTNSTDFFNSYKLLETFDKYVLGEHSIVDVTQYFENLLKYRLLFDYFVIRLNSENDLVTNYSLNMINENNGDEKERVVQYQSMLYVGLQYYIWLTPLLEKRAENYDIDYASFSRELKEWDNKRVVFDKEKLTYQTINRYWFWRLDYYLWENRNEFFKDRALEIANKYLFKQNRSIEHIAPQQPKGDSNVKVNDTNLHNFGNLVMISSGQNSSLQNETYQIKQAHVKDFINNNKSGTIESLKLLKVMELNDWDDAILENHQKEMLDILDASFQIDNINK